VPVNLTHTGAESIGKKENPRNPLRGTNCTVAQRSAEKTTENQTETAENTNTSCKKLFRETEAEKILPRVTDHCAVSTQTSERPETENREEKKFRRRKNLAIGL